MSMGSYSGRAYYRVIFANEDMGELCSAEGGGALWNFTGFSCRELCYV